MSDTVKIGGDSTELINAIDRAEKRFQQFDRQVNSGGFDKNILDRQKKIVDASGPGVAAAASEARRATVDWRRLAEVRASALGSGDRIGTGSRKFPAARPGQFLSSAAAEKAEALEVGTARAKSGFGSRIAGDIINIGTASSGAVMKVSALTHVLGSVGPAVGIVAAATAGYKLYEALEKAQQQAIALDQAIANISRSKGSADFLGVADINKNLSEATKQLDAIKTRDDEKAIKPLAKTGRFIKGALTGRGTFAEQEAADDEQKATLRKSASDDIDKLAQKTRALNEIERERAHGSERQSALLKAEVESKERLRQLAEAEANAGVQNPAARNAESDRLGAEQSLINRNFDEQEKVAAAQLAISSLRGSEESKTARTLQIQLELAEDLLKTGGSDVKQKERANEIVEKTNALLESQLAIALKRIQADNTAGKSNIDRRTSRAGVDASAEERQRLALQAAEAKAQLDLNAAHRTQFKKPSKQNLAKVVEAGNAVGTATDDAARFERETQFAREQSLNSAKATTHELELMGNAEEFAAQQASTRAQYESQIAQALHDGRDDLAEQLETQRDLTLEAQKFQRFKETGRTDNAPTAEERQNKRDRDLFNSIRGDEDERTKRGAYKGHGTPDGSPRERGLHSSGLTTTGLDRDADGKLSGRKSDKEFDEQFQPRGLKFRDSDKDFRSQFKPLQQQADEKRAAADAPKDADKGPTALIGKMDTLVSAINALPGKIGVA